jgi:hypothetical protein
MTSRERFLMWVGLGAACFLVVFVGYTFVWSPLEDAYSRRQTAEDELAKAQRGLRSLEAQNKKILELDPRLAMAKEISLPPRDPSLKKLGIPPADQQKRHEDRMRGEYEGYLRNVLDKAGFKSYNITGKKGANSLGAAGAKSKEIPLFERLVFTVSARGPQGAAYKALQNIYATPLLHVVRDFTLSVARPESRGEENPNILQLDMTVEALMYRDGDDRRATLLPSPSSLKEKPKVLAEPARDYSLLAKRSLFTGIAPLPKEPKEPPKEGPKGPSREDRIAALEFVKVTMLAWTQPRPDRGGSWEATMYDQAQGKDEIRVDDCAGAAFTIRDGETVMLEAVVRHIDAEQLIFESEGRFYRARLGEFLGAVYQRPLSTREAWEMGLK